MLDLPNEGPFKPTNNWIAGFIKDIQHLNHDSRAAFSCISNRSATGTGKVWRRAIWAERDGQWELVSEVKKVPSWRGKYKVEYHRPDRVYSENWFKSYLDAEAFLLASWSLFV